ncbi:pilus assembly protein [Glaciimonas sp. GNP009]
MRDTQIMLPTTLFVRLASSRLFVRRIHGRGLKLIRDTAVSITGLTMMGLCSSALAEIAQSPLFLAEPPPPNLMFIYDNSGSMNFETLTGDDVTNAYTSPQYNHDKYGWICKNFCFQQPDKNQAAFFSSDWNPIYYNPALTYTPGLLASGRSMANANATSTLLDGYAKTGQKIPLTAICHVTKTFKLPLFHPQTFATNKTCTKSGPIIKAQYAYYYTWHGQGKTNGSQYQDQFYVRTDILPSTAFYPRASTRSDCTKNATKCTYNEEIQNFANWFSYHRSRHLAMKTMLGIAFSGLSDRFRIGFSTINQNKTRFVPIASFTSAQKSLWYEKLYTSESNGGTPLAIALDNVGKYYQGLGMPGISPAPPDPIQLKCQSNYAILSTDGFWNLSNSKVDNFDKSVPYDLPAPVPLDPVSGKPFIPGQPFPPPFYEGATPTSGTLADTAMKYWLTDIGSRPGQGGTVGHITANNKDPATWQHMVTYTVSLGASGVLKYQPDYQTSLSGDYAGIKGGYRSWPVPVSDKSNTIDDLWHAAVNGRGSYLNAQNPTILKNGLIEMLKSLSDIQGAGSSIAYAGATVGAAGFSYAPSFQSTKWTGHLKAYSIKNGVQKELQWDAATLFPPWDSRNIVTWNTGTGGIKFSWSNLDPFQKIDLGSESISEYLRGNKASEQTVNSSGGTFRYRENLLGDIINSSPLHVGKANFGYATSASDGNGGETYAAFLKKKESNRAAMVYVGANDGMLHGFDAQTGIEKFAFIPNSVYPHLKSLSDPAYKHHYFVDGQLAQGDAYLGGQWKNILLGSTGAGSHGVFAIDVTSPASLGARSILWELGASGDFKDLGNVLGTLAAVRLTNGRWAAIFGNGYNSASGRAILYVVDLASGKLIHQIDTRIGDTLTPNGLSTPGLLFNHKRELIAAYAGDLKGNLWKFDMSSTSPYNWVSKKMFTATTANGSIAPIVQQPLLTPHPTAGFMVTFGTGKYYETADKTNTDKQALYGVWDKPGLFTTKDRGDLQQQGLTPMVQNGVTVGRILTNRAVDWSSKRGWYIDMLDPGERFVGRLQVIENVVLLSTTLGPTVNPCDGGGTSYTMATDILNGSVAKDFVFVDKDGKPIQDAQGNNASAIGTGGTSSEGVSIPGTSNDCITINQLDGKTTCIPYVTSSEVIRRWRQIVVSDQ